MNYECVLSIANNSLPHILQILNSALDYILVECSLGFTVVECIIRMYCLQVVMWSGIQ